jgi:hypothetical protein
MKVRPSVGSSRIGVKDEREKDDFSTHFPHVFHSEKTRFYNGFGKFSTKNRFPIFLIEK